jgi:hypothetical protein
MNQGFIRMTLNELAVGCVVTKTEHNRLSEFDRDINAEELTGWDRYEEAGIIAVDMMSMRVVNGPLRHQPFDLAGWRIVPPSVGEILNGEWPIETPE